MQLTVHGKNMEVTDALRKYAEKKIGKVKRYFDDIIEVQVVLSLQDNKSTGNKQVAEATIFAEGAVIRGEEATSDMYASIDSVAEKVERQIKKHKERLKERWKRGRKSLGNPTVEMIEEVEEEEEEPRIVKTKRFPVKPMPAEEAVLQMEMLGHDFYVFRNAETEEINIVYKRRDWNYGLIEPTL